MKRIIHPTSSSSIPRPVEQPAEVLSAELLVSDLPVFDIERLLSLGGEILRREVANLMRESSKGKLDAGCARDLVAYIKLLSELKAEQMKELQDMSDDELAKKLSDSGDSSKHRD